MHCVLKCTPPSFSSSPSCTRVEVQDSHRGPAQTQAHGFPGRRRAGQHHEGQGLLLAEQGRLPGEGPRGAATTGRRNQMNKDSINKGINFLFLIATCALLIVSINSSVDQFMQ